MVDTHVEPSTQTLPELLARRARSASDGRLALDAAGVGVARASALAGTGMALMLGTWIR
jgi:hypothetical protein